MVMVVTVEIERSLGVAVMMLVMLTGISMMILLMVRMTVIEG